MAHLLEPLVLKKATTGLKDVYCLKGTVQSYKTMTSYPKFMTLCFYKTTNFKITVPTGISGEIETLKR